MSNFYLTESTRCLDTASKSFEFLLPESRITSRGIDGKFNSSGNGIISDQFYIGNNLTEYMIDIEIKNMNGCVLSIPKRGYYTTTVSNKRYHHIEKKIRWNYSSR